MIKIELGKLEKMEDLHEVWESEPKDFTPWLAKEENLALLSKTLGLNTIIAKETESAVGDFRADILAEEETTGTLVVIENQLEQTDHRHLGQIITYAAGKGAGILILGVRQARDEHRQAVRWLNDKTGSDVDIYLLEMELWRIGNSAYAPKFNIVESPNNLVKATKDPEGSTETGQLQLNFWQEFKEYASGRDDFQCFFPFSKISVKSWHNLNLGEPGIYIQMRFRIQKKKVYTGIYIVNNKPLYQGFVAQKEEIERFIGEKLDWNDATKDSVFLASKEIDVNNRDSWNDAFQWLCDMSLKFKECYRKFYREVPSEEEQDTNVD